MNNPETNPDLSTTIADIKLQNCLMNASGCLCTNPNELTSLNNSTSGAIVTKSSTLNPRSGHQGEWFYSNTDFSINSNGLRNLGYKYYNQWYLDNNVTKPYIQSLYPFDNNELKEMFEYINTSRINQTNPYLIECNVSCPNININNSFEKIDNYLDIIKQNNINKIPLGLKLSPYFYPYEFDTMSSIILKYDVKFITCINSIPNCLDINIETETTRISPNGGLGGFGGKPIFPLSLSNVHQFNNRIGDKINLIGCGGVNSGEDVYKYLLAGASAVQIGTKFCEEGYTCFDRINDELLTLMKKYNYTCINDIKGKLKVLKSE